MAARDYAAEITAALIASDIGALAKLAFFLLSRVEAEDERREKDAARKRSQPPPNPRKSAEIQPPENPRNSTEFPGNPRRENVALTTTAKATTESSRDRAREALDDDLSWKDDEIVAALIKPLVEQMGDLWPSAERFIARRDPETRAGWIREMAKLVTGSQFSPADLAQVCDDDAALKRPIGSPYGLRKFLQLQKQERIGNGSGKSASRQNGVASAANGKRGRRPAGVPPQHFEYPPGTTEDKPWNE